MTAAARPELHHVTVEQALLGSMLRDTGSLEDAIKLCDSRAFFEPLHGRIFDAACELHGAGESVTAANVRDRLNGDATLRGMRGLPELREYSGDYLSFLAGNAPLLSNVEGQAAIIKASAARRATLRALGHDPDTEDTARHFTVRRAIDAATAPLATDYLIKRLLAPSEFSVWYGPPSCGKSFAVLHACYGICLGQEVFGRRVRRAPVLYVCLEGETNFAKRLRAISSVRGQPESFFFIAERADFYETDADIEGVIAAAAEIGARLVVIDTLARVMGAGQENDGRDMARMIHAFDRIRRDTGAHVLVVHHTGKDDTRGMRGHSNLLAAADVTVEIKRDEEGGRALRVAKAKDDEEGEPQGFVLKVVEVGTDDEGDPITSCVVAEAGAIQKVERSAQLTPTERGWFADLQRIFDDHAGGEWTVPASVLTQVQCITREQAREGFRRKGRIGTGTDGNLTGADRQKLSAMLNSLKDKRKIGMTDQHVWLLRERQ